MIFLKRLKVMLSWRLWVRLFLWLFVLLLLGMVLTPPVILKSAKKAPQITTMSNLTQVGILLLEFDNEFGCYPNDETASKDPDLKDYTGQYSNDYLGQILAAGLIDSEEIFYAQLEENPKRSVDNDFSTKAKTLESGECSFAYIKGLSASDRSSTPVLLTPMTGDGLKFDPEPYKGRALVLRIDGSVVSYQINTDGYAILPNGKNIFEGGEDTVWGEEGFNPDNLCYANPPKYQFGRNFLLGRTVGIVFFLVLGSCVIVLLLALRSFLKN